jgi:hypothetical protein
VFKKERAYAPHCDASILHSPGACEHCDKYSDWQEYRKLARISFSDDEPTLENAPCPSDWFRSASIRDLWGGNQAKPKPGTCKLPPQGWYCTLDAGHDGPCPTHSQGSYFY